MRRAHTVLGIVWLLAALAVWPAVARANAFTEVQRAYSHSVVVGTLAPCAFSSATLEAALKEAPSYDLQYQADFTDAISAALAARASGACRRGSSLAGTAAALGAGEQEARPGALPGSVRSATAAGVPLVLIVAIGLGGGLLLAGLAWGAWIALGFDGPVTRQARHSLAEAEYRLGAAWTDLADRFGR